MSEIELELQKITGIKPKSKEEEQSYFKRLVDAAQDLPDDEVAAKKKGLNVKRHWEALSDEAQNWVNAGATAVNKDMDIESFPDDEPPPEEEEESGASEEGQDDAEEETPRNSRRGEKNDDDKEEGSSRRTRSRREDKEGEEGEEDEEAPRSRRGRRDAESEDDESETEPVSGEEEDEVASKRSGKANKGGAKKPAAKPAKSAKGKGGEKKVGAQQMIKRLIIGNPKLTSEQVVEKLSAKGLDATTSAVSTIRSGTLQTLRMIKELGMPKGDF